jgi:ATP-dependent DNA ligase
MPQTAMAGGLPTPMLAKIEPAMPVGEGWTYEPKWDGFRTIVDASADEVGLWSRTGRPLARFFPEIATVVASATGRTRVVLDGEIVMIGGGAMEFGVLQLRLHPAASRVNKLAAEIPATLVLFDLLRAGDEDLTRLPLAQRRERLAAVASRLGIPEAVTSLADVPPGPAISLAPWTDDPDVARTWFDDDAGIGQDGIIAKRADQPYQPGVRGWVKVKHRSTADCVVGGYRLAKGGDGIGALLLGLYDDEGHLHYVGHTSSFKAAERRAMLEALQPLVGGEGFGGLREPGGQSRWSAGKDTEWVPLEPILVAEVTYDRMQDGRMRHAATFVRWRDDRDARSCTWAQLGLEPPSWSWGSWDEGQDMPSQGS